MNEIWINVLESVYPVGSVYISTINTPPPAVRVWRVAANKRRFSIMRG